MKQAVVENTIGLWERFSPKDREITVGRTCREKDYSCFYEVGSASETPLWGSTLMEESPFIKSFD